MISAASQTASIIFLTPRMFITRFRLYPNIVRLISAATFFIPLIRKYPLFIARFIVPYGCSASSFLFFIFSGFSFTRLLISSRIASSTRACDSPIPLVTRTLWLDLAPLTLIRAVVADMPPQLYSIESITQPFSCRAEVTVFL
jgi:hypothetical protein